MKKRVQILVLIITFTGLNLFSQPGWTPVDSVYSEWISISPNVMGDSVYKTYNLESGDWVGIFSNASADSSFCLASFEYNASSTTFIPIFGKGKYNTRFYKIWKKNLGCTLDSVIVITKYNSNDTSIISSLYSYPIKVTYPLLQVCSNTSEKLQPIISRNSGFVYFSSPNIKIDSISGTISPPSLLNSSGNLNITLNSPYCISQQSFTLTVNPSPVFTIEKKRFICPDKTITLLPTESKGTYQWQWNDGIKTAEKEVTTPGTFIIEATDDNGCKQSDTVQVSLKTISIQGFSSQAIDADCDKLGNIKIVNINIQNGLAPFTYTAINTVNESESGLENIQEGKYKLKVEDADGCISNISNEIIVRKNCLNEYPVFCPNPGSKSENYFVEKSGHANVYDRNGRLICSFQAPTYWDGNDNAGKPVPMGTYLIVVGNEKPINITIIR